MINKADMTTESGVQLIGELNEVLTNLTKLKGKPYALVLRNLFAMISFQQTLEVLAPSMQGEEERKAMILVAEGHRIILEDCFKNCMNLLVDSRAYRDSVKHAFFTEDQKLTLDLMATESLGKVWDEITADLKMLGAKQEEYGVFIFGSAG